jgi:hypothetical protein
VLTLSPAKLHGPLDRQIDLERHAPADRHLVKRLNQASTDAEIVDVEVDRQRTESPSFEWPRDPARFPAWIVALHA